MRKKAIERLYSFSPWYKHNDRSEKKFWRMLRPKKYKNPEDGN